MEVGGIGGFKGVRAQTVDADDEALARGLSVGRVDEKEGRDADCQGATVV